MPQNDNWFWKLLGIDEDDEDLEMREAGMPPSLLFARALMRQGQQRSADRAAAPPQIPLPVQALGALGNFGTAVRGEFEQAQAGVPIAGQMLGQGIQSLFTPQALTAIQSLLSQQSTQLERPTFQVTPTPGLSAPTSFRAPTEPTPVPGQRTQGTTPRPGQPTRQYLGRPIMNRNIYMRQEAGGRKAASAAGRLPKPTPRPTLRARPRKR